MVKNNFKYKKIEYFLNVVHYFIYLEERWTNKKIERIIFRFIYYIIKYTVPSKYKKRIYRHVLKNKNKSHDFIYGDNSGLSIGMTNYIFGYISSSYSGFFSLLLLGVGQRYLGHLTPIQAIILIAIPLAVGYIPLHKFVFRNDRYLIFYKEFEKNNLSWHKKWKRIIIAYSIGAILTDIIGFLIMVIIASTKSLG